MSKRADDAGAKPGVGEPPPTTKPAKPVTKPETNPATTGSTPTGMPPLGSTAPGGTTTSTSTPVGPAPSGTLAPAIAGTATTPPTPTTIDGGMTVTPPEPIWDDCAAPEDIGGGLVRCESGAQLRVSQPMCESELPRAERLELVYPSVDNDGGTIRSQVPSEAGAYPTTPGIVPFQAYDEQDGTSYSYTCDEDADCTEMAHGYCEFSHSNFSYDGYYASCRYGCTTDDECGDGYVCECGSPVGMCVQATCRTAEDCGEAQACVRWEYNDGCGLSTGYTCAGADSECLTAADCDPALYESCGVVNDDGLLHCAQEECAIGRPFLIHGAARLAPTTARADWSSSSQFETCGTSQERNARTDALAALEWTRVGAMEHASIAAFARFAMQLLAVGAPPELLLATSRAMADETRHAQLAYGLAKRFGGRAVGPNALDIGGALDEMSFEEIVLTTLQEGCIGETVAALEAETALAHVHDAELQDVLRTIARDEAQHALLAWQFVQWAIAQRPELAAVAVARAERELSLSERARPSQHLATESLLSYGIVSDTERAALRTAALRDVVLPCMRALCAEPNCPAVVAKPNAVLSA